MGCEFGQSSEWNYASQLDWDLLDYRDHQGIQSLVRDLNRLHRSEGCLGNHDFESSNFRWASAWDSASSITAYLRVEESSGSQILVVGNFTPVTRKNYRIGVPSGGFWREILNSNSAFYGGDNVGNGGGVLADAVEADGMPQSLLLTLPGNTTFFLKREPTT
jgi:1,4-alpha-glucan branching enzyme